MTVGQTSDSISPPEVRTKRLRRTWIRFLLASTGVLILLVAVGFWWLSSNSIGNRVRDAGGRYRSVELEAIASAVLRARDQRVLHYVDFEGSDIDDQWLIEHRKGIDHLSDLVLFLRETRVTGEGLAALRGLQSVVFLDLTGTPLKDGDIAHIVALPRVHDLYIGRTGISDSALGGLAQMPNLVSVCIDASQATPVGMAGLATCPRLSGVMLLDANDECVERLARLSGLTSLNLVGEDVTAASLPTLRQLQGLQSLMFYGTDFSDDELLELQQSLPGCFIEQREVNALHEAREAAWSGTGE